MSNKGYIKDLLAAAAKRTPEEKVVDQQAWEKKQITKESQRTRR